MLGHAVYRLFAGSDGFVAHGTLRSGAALSRIDPSLHANLHVGIDVENVDALAAILGTIRPTAVINCVGLVKQLADASDPLQAIPINAILPHRLARLCGLAGARLIQVSTDCVFSGDKGGYSEADQPDARDLYGRSKLLGEVDYPNAITLRTSIIGPELSGAHGLIGWFLSQAGPVRGYAKAIFSGLPTVELARVIRDFVLPQPELRGVYHVSAAPIDKLALLRLVAAEYGHGIGIEPDEKVKIDRSLDSTRFRTATGYEPPEWQDLIAQMHRFG